MSTVWRSNGDCQGRHINKIALIMAYMGEEVDVTMYLRWFLVVTICKLRPSLYLLRTVPIIQTHKVKIKNHVLDVTKFH